MKDRHGRHRRSEPDSRRGPSPGYRLRTRRRFERFVGDALASLSSDERRRVEGLMVVIAEIPPPSVGLALATVRGDRLEVYRRPIEARASSKEGVRDLVRDAVIDALED